MSHWTKSKVQIKNLNLLRRAAEKLGCTVEEGNLTLRSQWQGPVDAVMLIHKDGGTAGILEQEDGTYSLQIDNYHNPLAKALGNDCATLMRDYTCEVVKQQAGMMGGMVANHKLLADGSVEIQIALG